MKNAAIYRVEDLHNALRIKVHKPFELWERLILTLGLAAFVATVSFNLVGWWSVILVLSTAISVFALLKGMDVQLYATKLEFVTTGNVGRRGGRGRFTVFTADVQRLEFRDPVGQRSGLYAATARKGHCILPFLDYLQTKEVIQAIENKFPGLADHWRENTASNRGSFLPESLRGLF